MKFSKLMPKSLYTCYIFSGRSSGVGEQPGIARPKLLRVKNDLHFQVDIQKKIAASNGNPNPVFLSKGSSPDRSRYFLVHEEGRTSMSRKLFIYLYNKV